MKKRSSVIRVARRSEALMAVALLGVGAIIGWLVSVGPTPSLDLIPIGIAVISALFAGIAAMGSLLQAIEVQRQRRDQERPYINAYFDGSSTGAICFIIENNGNSPAYNIQIRFTPSPVDFANRPLNEISIFANAIDFFPPGKVMRQVIDSGYKFLADGKETKFSVSIDYQSVYGDSFPETIEYDLAYLKQATIPPKTVEDHLKVVTDKLDSLVRSLERVRETESSLVETLDEYMTQKDRANDQLEVLPGQHIPMWKRLISNFFSKRPE